MLLFPDLEAKESPAETSPALPGVLSTASQFLPPSATCLSAPIWGSLWPLRGKVKPAGQHCISKLEAQGS